MRRLFAFRGFTHNSQRVLAAIFLIAVHEQIPTGGEAMWRIWLATDLFKVNSHPLVTNTRNDPRPTLSLNSDNIAHFRSSLCFCHTDSVTQQLADCYRCANQTAPVPKGRIWRGFRAKAAQVMHSAATGSARPSRVPRSRPPAQVGCAAPRPPAGPRCNCRAAS